MLRLRHCLAFVLFAGSGFAGHAQTTLPVAPPVAVVAPAAVVLPPLQSPAQTPGKYRDYLMQRYANDREASAAVHMFGRKQTGGALWLGGGAAFLGFAASQTGTTRSNSGTTTFTISPFGYLVLIGLPAGIAIGKFSRFNNNKLYQVLRDYDQTHALPGYVIAKLGQSDYR